MASLRLSSAGGSQDRRHLIGDRAQLGGAIDACETFADEIDIDRPGDLARLVTGRAPFFRHQALSCGLMMSRRLLHGRIMNKALRARKALWGIVDKLPCHTGALPQKVGEPLHAIRGLLNLRLGYISFIGANDAVVIQ